MKLTLRSDLGGYALERLQSTPVNGMEINKPFVLFTGPNGCGKSAILRGIRGSMGLRGERAGQLDTPFEPHLAPAEWTDDIERLATHTKRHSDDTSKPHDHIPVVFSLDDLRWHGQQTYLFDSRAASSIATSNTMDDDMRYHLSLVAGGGTKVSHGQFVSKTWWEALEWAAGANVVNNPWSKPASLARKTVLAHALKGSEPPAERWLFIDEPETAIDTETLILGFAALISLAEEGKLRVFCASHSLLFAAGLIDHPKIQTINLGSSQNWMTIQKIALGIAKDERKLGDIGDDIVRRLKEKNQ
jgi:hypothetical protein